MVKLLETTIFSDDFPTTVKVDEVVTLAGKPLRMARLIQRLWGWPGKAARKASKLIMDSDEDLVTRGPLNQQLQLMAADPSILDSLLNGLSLSSSRNSRVVHRSVHGVQIEFTEPLTDEGMIAAIIKVISARLGSSTQEVRAATDFEDIDGKLLLTVDNYAHELGEGEDYD